MDSSNTGNPTSAASSQKQGLLARMKWVESYTSLLLGIAVVVIAGIILVLFFLNRRMQTLRTTPQVAQKVQQKALPLPQKKTIAKNNTQPKKTEETSTTNPQRSYTVAAGDNLWQIAEKTTGSGYNWVAIAKANNLAHPGLVHAGNALVIPSFAQKQIAQNTQPSIAPTPTLPSNAITGYEYTTQKGDSLWDIAVRAYGDGFKWVQIARANDLANPDLIHSGNVLKIPRPKIL